MAKRVGANCRKAQWLIKKKREAGLSLAGGTGNEADISQGSGSASGFLSAHRSMRSSASSKSTYSTATQKSLKETEPKARESVFTTSKPEGPSVMKSLSNSKPLMTKFSGGQSP